MSAAPWARLQQICLEALDLPREKRSDYLDRACHGDADLRSEIESLLAQEDPDFLEEPLVRVRTLDGGPDVPSEDDPRRIGGYRIVRRLGAGGMGEVFLAIEEGPGFERPVAIKLVRAGVASEEIFDRFRLERRILAGLNHPNLARLIAAGAAEDGRPFFVMEFVEGVSITQFADDHALSVEARLELFLAVCDAVHHAHQSLVVHRDIKPSNILVTADGVPKLLDFGIGKMLDADLDPSRSHTSTSARVLTPEYAAPEQVRGGVITTATDVHGLGVLLYELLSGHHPFAENVTSQEQLDRALLETTPSTPSTVVLTPRTSSVAELHEPSRIAEVRGTVPARLRRRLRGDLDNIVLVALRKEPERRYTSVDAFRADILRHLEGRPVLARPDSLTYRVTKFSTRNPWGVATGGLVAAAIAAAIVIPLQQNRLLTEERDKARAVQGFLLEAYGATGADEAIGARQLLDLQAGRIDDYADRPALQAQMALVLAEAYDGLGVYEDALPLARRALGILRTIHEGSDPELAAALNTVGWALHRVGNDTEAAPVLVESIEMRRRLGKSVRGELARSLNDLGVVREALGDYEAASGLHREALDIRRSVLGRGDLATGVSASNLSVVLYRLRDYEGARWQAEEALAMLRTSVGPDHQRTIIVQNNLAAFKVASGDSEGAAAEYADLLDRQTRLQGAEHPVNNSLRRGLAEALIRLQRWDEANEVLAEALHFSRQQGDAGFDAAVGALVGQGDILFRQDRIEESLATLDDAFEEARTRVPTSHPLVQRVVLVRAAVREAAGDDAGAAQDVRLLVDRMAALTNPSQVDLVGARARMGRLLVAAGDPETGRRELLEALAGAEAASLTGQQSAIRIELALAYVALDRGDEAESVLLPVRSAALEGSLTERAQARLAALDVALARLQSARGG